MRKTCKCKQKKEKDRKKDHTRESLVVVKNKSVNGLKKKILFHNIVYNIFIFFI